LTNYLIIDKDFITYIVIWYNHNLTLELAFKVLPCKQCWYSLAG